MSKFGKFFLAIGNKSRRIVWMFRAAYIGALCYFGVVCFAFYQEARQENVAVNSIRAVNEWFFQAEEKASSLYDRARRLNRKYAGLISPADSKIQLITDAEVVEDMLSLYNAARLANDRFFILAQAWENSISQYGSGSRVTNEYKNLDRDFSIFFDTFQSDDIYTSRTPREMMFITQSLVNASNTSLKAADVKIRKTLKHELEMLATHLNELLEQFLRFALGGVIVLAFFIFLPIDYFLATLLRRLREDNVKIKEVVKKAKGADRAKSEFLANMSHEIRTPMNGVMGMAELLMRTDLSNKQRAFAEVIIKSGTSLLTIINDILDFSKIDAGQLELDVAPFKLADAVEDVAAMVSAKVAEKDLELAVRISPDLPDMVVGDVGRIRQVVSNIIGNAVKFTEAGHVYVNLEGEVLDEYVRLNFSVKDTGIGISPEKCDQIFEKFSQVDESSSRKHEGTGLGLAISSSLVRLMGGKISVESEPGKGSTFRFIITLPIHGEVFEARRAPVNVKGSRVLVVDANEVSRSIMSENMASWEFDGAVACDANEAIAVMRSIKETGLKLDCVVLDYHMPDMTGAELAENIRVDQYFKDVPIIMMATVDETENGRNFSSLEIQGHLVKPVRSSLLLDTIVTAINESNVEHSETISGVAIAKSMAKLDVGMPEIGTGTIRSANANVELAPLPAEIPAETMVDAETSPEEPQEPTEVPAAALEFPESEDNEDSKVGMFADFGIVRGDHDEHSSDDADEDEQDGDDAPELLIQEVDVLIAEDNEVNQIVFTQILQNAGYTYVVAKNGRQAIEYCVKHKPRLICMDVSMPEMNGHEATKVIRDMQKTMGIKTPIIGVTAHAVNGDREMCIASGMDDYLTKPISPEKFEKLLRKWMGDEKPKSVSA